MNIETAMRKEISGGGGNFAIKMTGCSLYLLGGKIDG